uniref:SRCR domain-containing protein n=2 Tax=Sphaeramia orbicularis TaxID=375764 RepID=A0A673B6J5_9TELE
MSLCLCSDPGGVRLVGQPSRCAGTVEIQHQGHWRPVGDHFKDWDLKSGSAVCHHLDCGSAVSVNTTDDSTDRPVWFVSVPCVKLTSGLRDCVGLDDSYHEKSAVAVVCSDLLPQPNISLSDGVFEVYQQGFRVLVGSDFTVTCSVRPQYPGGSFQLISNTKKRLNLTLPAVNHSAHFLLSAMGYAHRGNYTCVYHVDVYNRSFSSSQSPALYLTVGDLVTNLIIRVVVLVSALLIFDLCLFFFYKVRSHLSSVDPLDFRLSHTQESELDMCAAMFVPGLREADPNEGGDKRDESCGRNIPFVESQWFSVSPADIWIGSTVSQLNQ